MPGFLDPFAPSVDAEYTRYLDPDILGKIVLKNFALHVLNLDPKIAIRIPISRQGDIGTYKDSIDAGIRFGNRWYSIESKCSRWNIAQRSRATSPVPRWVFNNFFKTPKGRQRDYDIAFAVGINVPGFEDSREYWKHLNSLKKEHAAEGRVFKIKVWPHEPAFLSRCGIYVLPRQAVSNNDLDITIRTLDKRADFEFFSWGHDVCRLKQVWSRAVEVVKRAEPLEVNAEAIQDAGKQAVMSLPTA